MDLAQVRTKLQGFGMQLLDGIDPNPDNFVCAGIVHMRAQQVGCLLRLEPNKQAQVICLILERLLATIASDDEQNLCNFS